MPKVERRLLACGEWFDVECAVRSDLSSPVAQFLDDLEAGSWPVEEDLALLEPDEQVDWRDEFLATCAYVAECGEAPHSGWYNQLRDGIWEFKRMSLRVSFYDTDGAGGHVPKIQAGSIIKGRIPWPEDFAEFLRLTTAFEKKGQKATEEQLRLAEMVREEDLAHDKS